MFQTLLYQLSHAGVKKGYASVTWFGTLSYNKFPHKVERAKRNICPLCENSLVNLKYVGLGDPPGCPKDEGEFFTPLALTVLNGNGSFTVLTLWKLSPHKRAKGTLSLSYSEGEVEERVTRNGVLVWERITD